MLLRLESPDDQAFCRRQDYGQRTTPSHPAYSPGLSLGLKALMETGTLALWAQSRFRTCRSFDIWAVCLIGSKEKGGKRQRIRTLRKPQNAGWEMMMGGKWDKRTEKEDG
ncbi:hypothetical protein FRC20_011659 [Serendipita sp. 405]|nr:hypothetical protein FRC16_000134 [Serendipita sp. 398]KAG8877293.1 hypothetical protein FRC20_011659 [Serendipita sp. 405]